MEFYFGFHLSFGTLAAARFRILVWISDSTTGGTSSKYFGDFITDSQPYITKRDWTTLIVVAIGALSCTDRVTRG